MGDETLPASVFLARTMFVLYDVYLPEGTQEIQVMVNFSTMMDFLECALANVTQDDLVHPLHLVLDNWLYLRYIYFFHFRLSFPVFLSFFCWAVNHTSLFQLAKIPDNW